MLIINVKMLQVTPGNKHKTCFGIKKKKVFVLMNHFTPQMQKNDTNADPCGEISKSTTETGKAALTV